MTEYFALNSLDKKLEQYLDYDRGFFVEIGANDGVNQSNTLYFEKYRSWRGVLVEPFPENAAKCRANRSQESQVFCAACVPFSYNERFVPLVYSNLMTAAVIPGSDIADPYKHALVGKQFLSSHEDVTSFNAEARTLNDILIHAQAPQLIDLFSLDVEGAEIPLLEGVDHERFRFKYLLVEARVFEKMQSYLRAKGYSFVCALSEHDYLFCDASVGISTTKPTAETSKSKVAADILHPVAPSSSPIPATAKRHRCVFLNTCYDAFLHHHYSTSQQLLSASYEEQLTALNQTFFGDSDFYSRGLRAYGFEALDLVVNCAPLQQAWAREYGLPAEGWELVKQQLDFLRPDVVYVQDMAGTPREVLAHARSHGAMVVGQIACELAPSVPLDSYDLIFSSFLHFVDAFRKAGLTSHYQPLAFEPRILDALGSVPYESRNIELSFIGGISSFHQAGTQLLERLARETPLQIWGYGAEQAPPGSAIAQRHRGQAWGLQMFSLFGRSKITINRHSEAASVNANNMRLFEATGSGALLITDYKDNLNELFEIGKEIVAYRSADECVALVRYFLAHPAEAKKIAEAGQRRTLRDHSYESRMMKTGEILARHLDYRSLKIPVPDLSRISSAFKPLSGSTVKPALTEAWKDAGMAHSQRGLVQQELRAMYQGSIPEPFGVAARLLSPVVRRDSSVLEIGCSSGYYYEALEYILKKSLRYTGCDYSAAMIDMARQFYPRAMFEVADGASLPFADREFEVVISGCVLLHCPNYAEHIKESCRVAESYILLHRTPISTTGETRLFEKLAYGVPTVELWFSESELLGLFARHGFERVQQIQYSIDPSQQVANISYLLKAGRRA